MHDGTRRQLVEESIGWDVTNWSKCLTFWERHGVLPDAADALEVGAGNNGGLTLWLASKGAHVVCSGLDQPSMASQAAHERYGVSDQVEYRHLDVLEMDYEDCFDVVVFKSVLGSIGRNKNIARSRQAITAMHRALKPGGELWFAENCAGTRLHQQLRNRYGWGKRRRGWRYVAWHEVESLMAPFVSCSNTTVGFVGVLGRTEQQRRALGYADSLLFDRLAPRPAKYILIGVARKARAAPRPAPAVEANWTVRTVGRGDLPAIARVHQAAFPSQPLSRLGRAAIRRYYEWRLLRRRDLVAVGAFRNGALVAFCFAAMVAGASRSFRVLSTGIYPRYEGCGLERRMLDALTNVSAGRDPVEPPRR